MFDIGWSELLLIGVVALVVIGPKDLPKALATAGKWMARARAMAREFQNNVDDMIRQSELEELRKQVQQARSFNIQDELEKSINPPVAEPAKPLAVEDFTTPAGSDPAVTTPAEAAAPSTTPAAPPVPPAAAPAPVTPAPVAPVVDQPVDAPHSPVAGSSTPAAPVSPTPTDPTKG